MMSCSSLQTITLYLRRIKHSVESGQFFLLIIGMKEKLNKKVHTHTHTQTYTIVINGVATNTDLLGYIVLETQIIRVTLTSLP